MGVEIRLHHLSGMSLVNTVFGVANLLIHGEVIDALYAFICELEILVLIKSTAQVSLKTFQKKFKITTCIQIFKFPT